ncbi:MAG: alpha-amylase/4-alpha-glucanotransferase domain-containing protein [Terriglobia bacterium]
MNKIYFTLMIHAHQPVGNFHEVIEEAYQHSYLPFLQLLETHPRIRLSLHFSGALLEWIERHHAEYFDMLRALLERRQIELMGGGFYEPILTLIPERDALAQIERLSDFLKSKFGLRPRGLWLPERLWEPQLPSTLARAHVDYLCLDDTHFLAAGLSPEDLFGYYITEDLGNKVRIVAGIKRLRYFIPFREPSETLDYLRSVSEKHAHGLVTMADDLEKFGAWPHTYEHVYLNGWLKRFFQALEENPDWIEMIPAGEYLEAFPPLGRVYLPTAAYSEMMTWALPPEKQLQLEEAESFLKNSDPTKIVEPFIHGGFFRNFFARYPEANLLHKRMIRCSHRLEELRNRGLYASDEAQTLWNRAYDHLLRAQSNDPYWHGVFGGLYAPHLRLSAQRNLSMGESCADEVELSLTGQTKTIVEVVDFDCDQEDEIYISAPGFSALFAPGDGATLQFLDFKPASIDVINTLRRRKEAYHHKVADATENILIRDGVKTIHEGTFAKEANLHRRLIYDPYSRNCFRLVCFPSTGGFDQFAAAELEVDTPMAGGKYALTLASSLPNRIDRSFLPRRLSVDDLIFRSVGEKGSPKVRKRFKFSSSENDELEIACRVDVDWGSTEVGERVLGLELAFNLLAPDEPDRYFQMGDRKEPLKWQGICENLDEVLLIDEYQKIKIEIKVPEPTAWWIVPLYAVAQSEDGFELIYEGSAILPHWKVEPSKDKTFHTWVSVRLTRLE